MEFTPRNANLITEYIGFSPIELLGLPCHLFLKVCYFLPVPPTLHVNLSYTDLTLALPTMCMIKVFRWLPITLRIVPNLNGLHIPTGSGPLLPLKYHLLPPSALQPLWPSFHSWAS